MPRKQTKNKTSNPTTPRVVGIVGVPPLPLMRRHIRGGARIVDLDEPIPGQPVSDGFLPPAFCSILKRVVSNILALRQANQLDLVIAGTGPDKCDGMRYIAKWLGATTDIPIMGVSNLSTSAAGTPISESQLPLFDKVQAIVNTVFQPFDKSIKLKGTKPVCGFWGVPPYDFEILKLFPDNTHVFGWTRCMENKTPADFALECMTPPGLPVVYFAQSFCQKTALAHALAKETGGLFVELDRKLTRSAAAKIEAYLRFNVNP